MYLNIETSSAAKKKKKKKKNMIFNISDLCLFKSSSGKLHYVKCGIFTHSFPSYMYFEKVVYTWVIIN